MRTLIFIASIMMLTSCYTKKQAIKKFCVPSSLDTIIRIHDTVQIPSSQIDTVFLQQHSDTVVVENDSVRVEYIRYRDTIYLRGTAKAKTVYITKEIPVRVTSPCPQPPSPPWWHEFAKGFCIFGLMWFLFTICVFLIRFRP